MAPLTIDLGPGQTIMAASSFVQGVGSRAEGAASTGTGNPYAVRRRPKPHEPTHRCPKRHNTAPTARESEIYLQSSWPTVSRKSGSLSLLLLSHKDHQ